MLRPEFSLVFLNPRTFLTGYCLERSSSNFSHPTATLGSDECNSFKQDNNTRFEFVRADMFKFSMEVNYPTLTLEEAEAAVRRSCSRIFVLCERSVCLCSQTSARNKLYQQWLKSRKTLLSVDKAADPQAAAASGDAGDDDAGSDGESRGKKRSSTVRAQGTGSGSSPAPGFCFYRPSIVFCSPAFAR